MNRTSSKVSVTAVHQHAFKANLYQAELRQTIIREYNAASVSNNMQSAFAPIGAYHLPESKYEKERVCWVDVPKGWTVDEAQNHLDKMYASGKSPCIYQVLSFEPILTDTDHAWMETLDDVDREVFLENKKSKQMVLDPQTGEVATKAGRTLFRKLFYSDRFKEDIDLTRGLMISAVDKPKMIAPAEEAYERAVLTF